MTRRTNCEVCGGLGVQVEVRPHGMAVRVCENGHRWVTAPVPGTEPDQRVTR